MTERNLLFRALEANEVHILVCLCPINTKTKDIFRYMLPLPWKPINAYDLGTSRGTIF